MDAEERASAGEFLLDQERWPHWPRLPMKNLSEPGNPQAAFFLSADSDILRIGGPVRLFRADLSVPFKILESECLRFETLDEMFDAGWRID